MAMASSMPGSVSIIRRTGCDSVELDVMIDHLCNPSPQSLSLSLSLSRISYLVSRVSRFDVLYELMELALDRDREYESRTSEEEIDDEMIIVIRGGGKEKTGRDDV